MFISFMYFCEASSYKYFIIDKKLMTEIRKICIDSCTDFCSQEKSTTHINTQMTFYIEYRSVETHATN